jgi:hypothetical protein
MSFGAMVVAGLALAAGALTFSEQRAQAAPEDDIAAMLQDLKEAWNSQDFETFTSLWTEALKEYFDIGDEDLVAFFEEEFENTGPIASLTVTDLFVTSGNASGLVDIQFEAGFSIFEEWSFIFQDQMWKIDGAEPAFRPIPEGVPVVDMTLQEYAFVYNPAAIQAADGNFAFSVTNVGQEEHEIVLLELTTSAPLGDVVEALEQTGEEEEDPEGVVFLEFMGFFEPGQMGTAIPSSPLAPGRYALVCFLEAPDGTPHVALGMISEFSVGQLAGGGITPPSTGDGGLLGEERTSMWALLGVALILVLSGSAGLVMSRKVTAA